jgi:hypothetical protein
VDLRSSDPGAVPLTLQDSLMARLDRLGRAKDIAQIASIIGRQFSYAMLEAFAEARGEELRSALAQLRTSGLVLGEGSSGQESTYSFKHALVNVKQFYDTGLARAAVDRGPMFSFVAAPDRPQLDEFVAKIIEGTRSLGYVVVSPDTMITISYSDLLGRQRDEYFEVVPGSGGSRFRFSSTPMDFFKYTEGDLQQVMSSLDATAVVRLLDGRVSSKDCPPAYCHQL